jgi:hypothetical protein
MAIAQADAANAAAAAGGKFGVKSPGKQHQHSASPRKQHAVGRGLAGRDEYGEGALMAGKSETRPVVHWGLAERVIGAVSPARALKRYQAKVAAAKVAAGDSDPVYKSKLVTAQYFVERWLPDADAHLARIESGAGSLMALDAEAF